MALFRDQVAGQFDDAVETLRAQINRVAQCQARGERAVRDRSDELRQIARRMSQLAEELDWMLLDER
jgi:prefoldin subunit 5